MITVYIGPTIVDFVVGDIVRWGFGFANPNHAAAAIWEATGSDMVTTVNYHSSGRL